jgi:hypothetical protein
VSTPVAYDVAAGFAGFHAVIAGSLGSSAGAGAGGQAAAQGKAAATATHAAATTKTAGLLGSAGAKMALAAIGTAAVVAGSVAVWPARPVVPSEPRHAGTVSSTAPSASPQPPIVDAPAAQVPTLALEPAMEPSNATRAPVAAPAHRLARSRLALAPSAAPTQVDGDDALRREIAQLAQIKAVVDTDPAQAYRLAQAGHREFGRGMLRQEREALAVLSLSKLGRRTEAVSRARAFLARYPQSPLRESLERLLHPEIE